MECSALKPDLTEVCKRVNALMQKHCFHIQFWWAPHKEKKETDSACRVAYAAGKTIVVQDNNGSLLGAVNVVNRLVASLYVHTCEECDISKMGDMDDANGSMGNGTLEDEKLTIVPVVFGQRPQGASMKSPLKINHMEEFCT